MSSRVVALAITDITNKWALAERICGHKKTPDQALRSVFDAAIQQLEVVAHTQFESPIKERIWEAISGQRLKDIRETCMLEFCDQILESFSEKEAAEMLEEHKRTGAIQTIRYRTQIRAVYAVCKSSIFEAIAKKASSMSNGLESELVAAVKREGIELPEPKRATRPSSSPFVTESTIPKKPKISHFEVLTGAVDTGDLDKVREALRNGANPNGSVGVQNIVHLACEKGNIDIVCELLDNGAELNVRSSKWADTPLHRACIFGQTAIVAELIKRGAITNIRNNHFWQTPLESAITFNHVECCKLLVQAGAKLNEVHCTYGSTPLKEACRSGTYELVKLLLDAQANPNLSSASGITPLFEAVHSPAILQLMLDRGAQANAPNGPGSHYQASHPIHAAASWGYDESVSILLKAGVDPKTRDGKGKTPVELARWELNNHRTSPCAAPDVTAYMIERLEKVIGLLEG